MTNEPVFFHIGPSKTGSSQLQRFFAKNLAGLSSHGICYASAMSTAREASGQILSGNGYQLVRQLKNDRKAAIDNFTAQLRERNSLLYSSEAFPELGADLWAALSETTDRPFKFIAYVRAPLDTFVSGAIQYIKRSGGTVHPREALAAGRATWGLRLAPYIKMLVEHFGKENIVVRHYDNNAFIGGRIETDFLDAVGIKDWRGFELLQDRVNPALGEEAVSIMIACNRLLSGEQRRRLSDLLMDIPGRKVSIPESAFIESAAAFEDDIEYFRREFEMDGLRAYTDQYVGEIADSSVSPEYLAKLITQIMD